jgi:hypothetical protein
MKSSTREGTKKIKMSTCWYICKCGENVGLSQGVEIDLNKGEIRCKKHGLIIGYVKPEIKSVTLDEILKKFDNDLGRKIQRDISCSHNEFCIPGDHCDCETRYGKLKDFITQAYHSGQESMREKAITKAYSKGIQSERQRILNLPGMKKESSPEVTDWKHPEKELALDDYYGGRNALRDQIVEEINGGKIYPRWF